MKRAVIVILFTVILVGCSKTITTVRAYFSDGDKEIQTALQAKAAAKSFRMTTKIAAHEDKIMETQFYVSCPDRERITLKISSTNREMIRIGQRFYINEDGTWYFKDVGLKDWSPCGRNPGLPSPWALLTEGRDMLAIFAGARDRFKVESADPVEYNGKKYKAWSVGMSHTGGGGPFTYTLLVDENHRPVVIAMGRSSLTEYSDWDAPVTIEAPANALPYPDTPEPRGGTVSVPDRSPRK